MDLTTVSLQARAEAEALIRDSLMSLFPTIDVSPGTALHELLAIPAGAVKAYIDAQAAALRTSLDLATSDDPAVVAALLENFKLAPNQGSEGQGLVKLIFDASSQAVVQAGTALKTGGTTLRIPRTYAGVVGMASIAAAESGLYRELEREGDYWVMYVPAVTTGGQNDPILPGQYLQTLHPIATLVRAESASTFIGGRTADTLDTLRSKWAESRTMPACCSANHIRKLLAMSSVPALDVKVAGAGSLESWRATSVFGVAPGGVVDVYSKTALFPCVDYVQVKATLVDAASRTWSAVVTRDLMPGFYRIESINYGSRSASRDAIVSETWSADVSNYPCVKCGSNPDHFRFSAFQQCVLVFVFAAATPGADGSAAFFLELTGMPGIKTHQAALDDPDAGVPGLDVLVRAPVPVFVSLGVRLHLNPGAPAPDVEALMVRASAAVNAAPMGRGWLSGGCVAAALASPDYEVVSPVMLEATLLGQDGRELRFRSSDTLRIPQDAAAGATLSTLCFMCRPSSVSITVK
jgi:hypothetical protein